MKSNLMCAIGFAVGAAVGSVATYFAVKNKYAKYANEEIEEVRAYYKSESKKKPSEENLENKSKSDILTPEKVAEKNEYAKLVRNAGYTNPDVKANIEVNNAAFGMNTDVNQPLPGECPYVISPDEFGEIDDYMQISLTYYSDGVLADEDDEIIDNVDESVGTDAFNHFGEYEDDAVFIRNDARKCDYEILMDRRSYNDAIMD